MAGREHLENVESGYLAALAQAKLLSAWINLPTLSETFPHTRPGESRSLRLQAVRAQSLAMRLEYSSLGVAPVEVERNS